MRATTTAGAVMRNETLPFDIRVGAAIVLDEFYGPDSMCDLALEARTLIKIWKSIPKGGS